MEVIILAGGLGTRLRSVISEVPKCMAPVAEKPFLWYLLKYLTRYEVSKIILSVGYLREVVFEWIEIVKKEFPFEFEYAIEEEPMGTGGGIKLAMGKVTDKEVVILNGDTFFEVNLDLLLQEHNQMGSLLSVALKPMVNFERYGTVDVDKETSYITCFREKQKCKEGQINGGVYILNNVSTFWEGLPLKFSFEKEVLQKYAGSNGVVHGFIHNNYFIDIGIPEDYTKANVEFTHLF